MIWFSSDFHFGHNKDFIYGPRGFDNCYDAAAQIIKNCQEVIAWDDTFYILGDVMLNDDEFGIKCLRQLPGYKHLIVGNHDSSARINKLKEANIFHSIECGGRMKYDKYMFWYSHYPMKMGNYKDKHPVWNLSGHTHSKNIFDNGEDCVYNVAVDAHNCYPVSIDQIVNDINSYRKINPVKPFIN